MGHRPTLRKSAHSCPERCKGLLAWHEPKPKSDDALPANLVTAFLNGIGRREQDDYVDWLGGEVMPATRLHPGFHNPESLVQVPEIGKVLPHEQKLCLALDPQTPGQPQACSPRRERRFDRGVVAARLAGHESLPPDNFPPLCHADIPTLVPAHG